MPIITAQAWHLWDVLPNKEKVDGSGAITKQWQELASQAPAVIEEQRQGARRGGLYVLKCYCALGKEPGAHTDTGSFWMGLTDLLHADANPWVHRFRRDAPERTLLGSYVVAAVPTTRPAGKGAAAGDTAIDYEYVMGFVNREDSKTVDVFHEPNLADHAVLAAQQRALGMPEQSARCVATDGAAADETTVDGATAAAPDPASSHGLRSRIFRRVPLAHVAPYPGRSLTRQYVKGQEVLVRWEAGVTITEGQPPNSLRPPKTWAATRWSSLCYPGEIVGSQGAEHLTVRYLHATNPDEVHTVLKRDVTLAPEKGEPDENERKRQRKARKRRDEERKKREDEKAAGGAAAAPEAAAKPLPVSTPTALSGEGCPGIDAAVAAREDHERRLRGRKTPPPQARPPPAAKSATPPPGSCGGSSVAASHAGMKRGGGEIEPAAAKQRKLEGPPPLGSGVAPLAAPKPVPTVAGASLSNASADASGNAAATQPGEGTTGLVAPRSSPQPTSGRKSTSPGSALPAAAAPAPSPPKLPSRPNTPPDLPQDAPGCVRSLCTFTAAASTASEAASAAVVPPTRLTPAEAAAELQGWRYQLGLAPPPKPTTAPLLLTGPAAGGSGAQGSKASGPLRFGLKAKKDPGARRPRVGAFLGVEDDHAMEVDG